MPPFDKSGGMIDECYCLPPLEHTSSGELLADAIQRLTEAIQKMFSPVSKANEAFEELGRLALSPRCYRKAVRWDEKNRRRRLKGLPEKPYPFPMTYQCDLFLPPQPGPINVKIEWSEGGAENDQSRDDEGA